MKNYIKSIKLYFTFYKSTLLVNWTLSFLIALLSLSVQAFASGSVTIGFLLGVLIKELKPKEYYFYYNMGISKVKLITVCFVLNFIICYSLVLIILLCQKLF